MSSIKKAKLFLLIFAFLASACRQDMHNQPRYEPLEPIEDIGTITDGRSARPLVEGTVARGSLNDDPLLLASRAGAAQANPNAGGQAATAAAAGAQGQTGQGFSNTFPFPVTEEVLDRGEERYNIYCSVCHDLTGSGMGMVVRRGYRKPPSFHEDRLRQAPAGYFFDVITNGFGAMPDYAASINPSDRWAIVAYIRALQLSQRATPADVPPEDRDKFNQAATQQGGNQR